MDNPVSSESASKFANQKPTTVNAYHKFVVNRWYAMMGICFTVSIGLGMVALVGGQGDLGASFADPTDIIVRRQYAFWGAIGEYYEEAVASEQDARTQYFGSLNLYFKSKKGNMFTEKNIESMRKMERKVLGAKGYSKWCQIYESDGEEVCYRPQSVNAFVYNDPAQTESCSCASEWDYVSCAAFDESFLYYDTGILMDENDRTPVLQELCSAGENYNTTCQEALHIAKTDLVTKHFQCDSGTAKYTRSSFAWGLPLKGYKNADDKYADQWMKISDWQTANLLSPLFDWKAQIESDNGDVEVYFDGDGLIVIWYYLNRDLMLVMGSFALVFLVMWQQSESVFLTICGMYQIMISFPLGLFIWYIVLQEPYVTPLMYVGVFIILGIGADNVFVFYDTWVQSAAQAKEISSSLETRIAWTYNKSAGAIAMTTGTTLVSFISCSTNPIWDIRCFGIVVGFSILMNYVMVMTWFPACVIMYEKLLKDRCQFCDRLLVSRLLRNYYLSKSSTAKSDGDAVGEMELAKVETPSQEASVVDNEQKSQEQSSASNNNQSKPQHLSRRAFLHIRKSMSDPSPDNSHVLGDLEKLRGLERFFATTYYFNIARFRWLIVMVFAALLIATTVVWTVTLEPAQNAASEFDDDHFVSITADVKKKQFGVGSSDNRITCNIVYGLKSDPLDDSKVHPANQLDKGRPRYRNQFSFLEIQEDLVEICPIFLNEMKSKGRIPASDSAYCAPSDFKEWVVLNYGAGAFPVTDENSLLQRVIEWRNSSGAHGLLNLTSFDPNYESNTNIALQYDSNGQPTRVSLVWLGYNTTLDPDYGDKFITFGETFDDWQKVMRRVNQEYTAHGYQTIDVYVWMVSQRILYASGIGNMVLSLALSVIVLSIATRNYRIVPIAVLSLYTIVSLVFGTMAWAGWTVNIIESICITMAAGMSVDYVVHIVHQYDHAVGTRHAKVQHALGKIAVSLTSGAITTVGACLPLLFCELLWFRIFGEFIVMVICFAYIVAMAFLPALLYTFGPDHDEATVTKESLTNLWSRTKRVFATSEQPSSFD